MTGMRVLSVDYPLAPEHVHPAAPQAVAKVKNLLRLYLYVNQGFQIFSGKNEGVS